MMPYARTAVRTLTITGGVLGALGTLLILTTGNFFVASLACALITSGAVLLTGALVVYGLALRTPAERAATAPVGQVRPPSA